MPYCLNCREKVKPTTSTFICEHCGVKQPTQSGISRCINTVSILYYKITASKTYNELFYPLNLLSKYRQEIGTIMKVLDVDIYSNDVHSVHLFKPTTSYKDSYTNVDVYVCRTYFPKVSIVWRSNIRDKMFGNREYSIMWEFEDSDFVSYKMKERLVDSLIDKLRRELRNKGFQLNDIATEEIPEFERHILMKYSYAKELREKCNRIINGLISKGFNVDEESTHQIIMSESTIGKVFISIDHLDHNKLEVSCNWKCQKFPLYTEVEDVYAFVKLCFC